MDYSNYYLRNYFRYHREDEFDDDEYTVIDEPSVEEPSEVSVDETPEQPKPHKYYARGVEIEVVPQLTSMVNTNYRVSEDDVIIDVEPQISDRSDSRRRGVIMTLAIIACLLLTIVVGDFATEGALLDGITSLYKTAEVSKSNYYLLIYKSTSSYQQARVFSDQMRLQGGGGYILKNGDNYLLIADVYDDLNEANAVVEKNSGSELLSYSIESQNYADLLAGGSELMVSMGGYSVSIVEQLATIGESLTKLEIDKSEALERINTLDSNLRLKYDELAKEDVTSNYNIKILMADIDTTLGLLENLLADSQSRPNLVCDIRYTKVQILLNYYTTAQKMAQEM